MGGFGVSYPILYDKNSIDFFNLGLGVLNDTISCFVIEELNGVFELDMVYPIEGLRANLIEVDSIIMVDTGHASFSKAQRFRIERIDKSSDGIMKIHAKHVSHMTNNLVLHPKTEINNSNASHALTQWRNAIIGNHNFTTSSNINDIKSTQLCIQTQKNARDGLGGTIGSILEVWGGEYVFDNYRIDLRNARGSTRNTLISYGRNLIDLNQEENISNTFTSIYPFAIKRESGNEKIFTLEEHNLVVDSINVDKFAHKRILPVDFSKEFEMNEIPTNNRLLELAKKYILENKIGIPRISISLSFVDLSKMLNYTESSCERLNLGDVVPVCFEKLNITESSKIVRVEWDVLLGQYARLEIGHAKQTLGGTIRNIERDINLVAQDTNKAMKTANGRNTAFFGVNQPMPNRIGDIWYFENGEITEMKVWNGHGWVFVSSTSDPEFIAGIARVIELDAKSITAGTISGIIFETKSINNSSNILLHNGILTTSKDGVRKLDLDANGLTFYDMNGLKIGSLDVERFDFHEFQGGREIGLKATGTPVRISSRFSDNNVAEFYLTRSHVNIMSSGGIDVIGGLNPDEPIRFSGGMVSQHPAPANRWFQTHVDIIGSLHATRINGEINVSNIVGIIPNNQIPLGLRANTAIAGQFIINQNNTGAGNGLRLHGTAGNVDGNNGRSEFRVSGGSLLLQTAGKNFTVRTGATVSDTGGTLTIGSNGQLSGSFEMSANNLTRDRLHIDRLPSNVLTNAHMINSNSSAHLGGSRPATGQPLHTTILPDNNRTGWQRAADYYPWGISAFNVTSGLENGWIWNTGHVETHRVNNNRVKQTFYTSSTSPTSTTAIATRRWQSNMTGNGSGDRWSVWFVHTGIAQLTGALELIAHESVRVDFKEDFYNEPQLQFTNNDMVILEDYDKSGFTIKADENINIKWTATGKVLPMGINVDCGFELA